MAKYTEPDKHKKVYKTEGYGLWMDDVKVTKSEIPGNKGIVENIEEPHPVTTRFGERDVCTINVKGSDGTILNVSLFLPQQFPMVHPKSNLGKILNKYGCEGMKDLINKEVELVSTGEGLWKVKVD